MWGTPLPAEDPSPRSILEAIGNHVNDCIRCRGTCPNPDSVRPRSPLNPLEVSSVTRPKVKRKTESNRLFAGLTVVDGACLGTSDSRAIAHLACLVASS